VKRRGRSLRYEYPATQLPVSISRTAILSVITKQAWRRAKREAEADIESEPIRAWRSEDSRGSRLAKWLCDCAGLQRPPHRC
jgi:hypothetical protein